MFRIAIPLAFLAAPVAAQAVDSATAMTIISEGRVISAAPVTPAPPPHPVLGPMTPEGTRIHEVFVAHDGRLFLCFLRGGTVAGAAVMPTCYGG